MAELKFEIPLGVYDDPENQAQDLYLIDLYRNNLAIFGSTMSGKTTMLKTLISHIHRKAGSTDMEHIYILDFGGNLSAYGEMPYVLAYFDASNEENVRRLFKKMTDTLSKNAGNATYTDMEDNRPAHVTFIIDGLSSFLSQPRYEKYLETLVRIAREGLQKGITVIFAATEVAGGGISKLLPHFKRKIAFDLPKSDNYFELFARTIDKTRILQRRGFANIDANVHEFQGFLPFSSPKQGNEGTEITDISAKMRSAEGAKELKKEKTMLRILDIKGMAEWKNEYDIDSSIPKLGCVFVGLDYYTFEPYEIELSKARSIAIYGSKGTGKTNLLWLILRGALLSNRNVRFVFWDDKRNGLAKIFDEMLGPFRLPNGELNPERVAVYTSQSDFANYIEREYPSSLLDVAYIEKDYSFPFDYKNSTSGASLGATKSSLNDKNESEAEEIKTVSSALDVDSSVKSAYNFPPTIGSGNSGLLHSPSHNMQTTGSEANLPGLASDLNKSGQTDGSVSIVQMTAIETSSSTTSEQDNCASETLPIEEVLFGSPVPTSKGDEEKKEACETSQISDLDSEMDIKKDDEPIEKPFTVFIIQNKEFYQKKAGAGVRDFLTRVMPFAETADEKNALFIFADVTRISDQDLQMKFNSALAHAFLTSDIFRFIGERGNKTVFANEELDYLKESFGAWEEKGDGFYLNLETDRINKVKFIKAL